MAVCLIFTNYQIKYDVILAYAKEETSMKVNSNNYFHK